MNNMNNSFSLNGSKGYWQVQRYSYSTIMGTVIVHAPIVFHTKKSAKDYIRAMKLELKNQA